MLSKEVWLPDMGTRTRHRTDVTASERLKRETGKNTKNTKRESKTVKNKNENNTEKA